MAWITHFKNLITDIKYIGILARQAFNKAILAVCDVSFPCQPRILYYYIRETH
jgi:hypothetical protein